jgi:anti-sigma B factor antagonist
MTEDTLQIAVRESVPGVAVVDIHGDITPAVEEQLMKAYRECEHARAILLNFEALDYLNSGGIGLLVTLLVRAQRHRQRLHAYGLSDHYRQIFELTRLDDAITIHDDETGALSAAGGDRHG